MRNEREKEKMLSFMKDKYGEEFDYVGYYAGQSGKSYTMIRVSSREQKERTALVRYSVREGENFYEDNYLSYLLKEELERTIGDLAKQILGECEIRYKIPDFVFPYDLGPEMSAEEFLRDSRSMPQFYIYPGNKSGEKKAWEEKIQDFRERIAGEGYRIRGILCISNADELLFSMDREGNFRYMRWKERKVKNADR